MKDGFKNSHEKSGMSLPPSILKRIETINLIDLSTEADNLTSLMPFCLYDPCAELGSVLAYSYKMGYLKTVEAKACSFNLMKMDFWLSNPMIVRQIMEIWASLYEVEKKILKYINNPENSQERENFINYSKTLVHGTRYFTEIKFGDPNFPKARNILTAIGKLDKGFPEKKIKRNYDILCEMCHPNFPFISLMVNLDIQSKAFGENLQQTYFNFINLQLDLLESSIKGIKTCLYNIFELCNKKIDPENNRDKRLTKFEELFYDYSEDLLKGDPIKLFSIRADAVNESGRIGISIDIGKLPIDNEFHRNVSQQLAQPVKFAIDSLSYDTKLAISSKINKFQKNKPIPIFSIDVFLVMDDDGKSLWYTSAFIDKWASKFEDIVQNALYAREKCLEIICSIDFS